MFLPIYSFLIRPRLRIYLLRIGLFLLLSSIELVFPSIGYAWEVEPYPDDSLVTNPWFRKFNNPTDSSLDGWIDAGGTDKYWSSSQKVTNPSPDIVISGVCGRKKVYCGTAARLSPTPGQSGGLAEPDVDSYLYQVVASDPTHQKLKFSTYWVSHRVDIAEVVIYGSDDEDGPWEKIWTPWSVVVLKPYRSSTGNRADEWNRTEVESTIITSGYPFYKVEIHVRLPVPRIRIGDVGFKITGVYFATEKATTADLAAMLLTGQPPDSPTPTAEAAATLEKSTTSPTSTVMPGSLSTIEKTPTLSSTDQANIQSSSSPAVQSPYSEANLPGAQPSGNLKSPVTSSPLIGWLSAGLVFVITLVVILRTRRNGN